MGRAKCFDGTDEEFDAFATPFVTDPEFVTYTTDRAMGALDKDAKLGFLRSACFKLSSHHN